ncbi:MAG: hypothetical protein ACREKM_07730 [Longimicrobiales bacterium]
MKTIVGVLSVGLAACAAREPAPTTRGPIEERVTITGADGAVHGEIRITRDDYIARERIDVPVDAVWDVLPAAYEAVGLPQPQLDRANGVALLEGHLARRRVGEERMSRLIECGSGMTGPYADRYRILLTVTTELRPDGDATHVFTRVTAIGGNTSGTGGDVQCVSRGRLEAMIAKALAAQVPG